MPETPEAPRWSEEERRIFRFQDGQGQDRFADPLAVERRLWNLLPDLAAAVEDAQSADDDRCERAMRKLRVVVCDVFGLGRPLDPQTGEGATDGTVLRVLNGYFAWAKKNGTPSATSPPPSPPMGPAS